LAHELSRPWTRVEQPYCKNWWAGSCARHYRIIGSYRPTERNRLVEDHYAKLGFTKMRMPDGRLDHVGFDVADYKDVNFP